MAGAKRRPLHASRTGSSYLTKADASGVRGLRTFWIGHTLPRDAAIQSVKLDNRAVRDYEARETNRGLEVRVRADPDDVHTLSVKAR